MTLCRTGIFSFFFFAFKISFVASLEFSRYGNFNHYGMISISRDSYIVSVNIDLLVSKIDFYFIILVHCRPLGQFFFVSK